MHTCSVARKVLLPQKGALPAMLHSESIITMSCCAAWQKLQNCSGTTALHHIHTYCLMQRSKIHSHHDYCLLAQIHRCLNTHRAKIAHVVLFTSAPTSLSPGPTNYKQARSLLFSCAETFLEVAIILQTRVPNWKKKKLWGKLVFFLEISDTTHFWSIKWQ